MQQKPLRAPDFQDAGRLTQSVMLLQATRHRFPSPVIDVATVALRPWPVEILHPETTSDVPVRSGRHAFSRLALGLRKRIQEIEFTHSQPMNSLLRGPPMSRARGIDYR